MAAGSNRKTTNNSNMGTSAASHVAVLRARNAVAAAVAASFVASCSLLPPGMRGEQPAAPTGTAAGPQPQFGPVPSPAKPVAQPSAAAPIPPKLYTGTGNFVNTKPPAPQPAPGPEEASLNFEGLDVREVAKVILGDYLKLSYTVHPAVAGTVTFRTVRPIPLKELLPTLEMLLRQNNAAVVQEEGIYKVLPITAIRGSVSPQLGGVAVPIQKGFSIAVVPLRYVGAVEMQHILEPFAPEGTVRADTVRNLVILAGNEREMKHLIDTIELFDVDWLAGYSVGLFPIKSTDVKTIAQDFQKIFEATGPGGANPLAGVVRVIPVERLNAFLIVTTQPKYLEMARTWLDRIDQSGATSAGSRIYVYQVRNGKAENLAQLVGDLFSARRTTTTAPTLAPGARPTEIRSTPFGQTQPAPQTTTTSVTPLPGATAFTLPGGVGATANEVRVIADKDTNSLLIVAAPSDYNVIEDALRRLDVVRRQVLVEVLLAEVTLSDDLQFGMDWYLRTHNNLTGSLNQGGLSRTSRALADVPGFSGLQLISLTGDQVRAVLNTLGADGRTQILASPQVMVLDNEKAEIKVGDRISVQTQTQTGVSTGTGVLNSFQYLETGILLAVTPRINSGGMVTLEVNQEVSEADPSSVTATNPNPNVSTRNAKTSVQVASGESIVLGGLIREKNGRTTSGIPLLSKIPVLGAVFGHQTIHRERTELVLVITPKIVSDTVQAREVTEELRRKLPSLEGLLPKPPATPVPAGPAEPPAK